MCQTRLLWRIKSFTCGSFFSIASSVFPGFVFVRHTTKMERCHGDKIVYPVDIGVLLDFSRGLILRYNNSTTTSSSSSGAHLTGILAIRGKRDKVHLNALRIDCQKLIIERFEPYGSRRKASIVKRDNLIDWQLEQLVSKFLLSAPTTKINTSVDDLTHPVSSAHNQGIQKELDIVTLGVSCILTVLTC